jgi:hypothetical protein
MAERLTEQARKIASGCTYAARQISLSRDLGTPVTTLRIAKCFDRDPGFRAELVEALRHAAAGFERILVPGMLGLDSSEQQMAQFERELGCFLSEIPALPPSIPGLRLFHRLSSYLLKAGVELYFGYPVQKVETHDGSWIGLHVASPGHPLMLRGESVVLAAGRHSASLLDEQLLPLASASPAKARNLLVAGSLPHNGADNSGDVMEIFTGYCAGNLAAATRGCYAAG